MISDLLIPSAVRPLHILLGPRIVTQPDHNDAIERRISLAITTTIETMTVSPLPDDAGTGFTPHSDANAPSE